MKITYTSTAVRDIREKRDYIANNLKNKGAAEKLVSLILNTVSLLADNPRLGVSVNSKFDLETDLRYLAAAKQLIFYRLLDDRISIVRVIDGRQDYMAILFPDL